MTPADIAKMLRSKECPGEPHGNKVGMFDGLAQDECWMCIADAIAAALRERDATWTKALALSHYNTAVHLNSVSLDCKDCAPLRALLEEAGK